MAEGFADPGGGTCHCACSLSHPSRAKYQFCVDPAEPGLYVVKTAPAVGPVTMALCRFCYDRTTTESS